jgi:hypothetical protein
VQRPASIVLLALAAAGCSAPSPNDTHPAPRSSESALPPAPQPASTEDAPAGACPHDMRLVEGQYCPAVQQRCAARKQLDPHSRPESNNCQTYAEPTVCLAPRRTPMRYCMDVYEWPNEPSAMPRVLVSWQEARELCAARDKRLCTEEEFNFACEGEAMRPYVYGFERDPSKCNFDKPYRQRTFAFTPWETCMGDGACKAAFDAIDQRQPAGSNPACQSPEGIFDLNGNVNEWVMLPGKKGPHRSGLKGGWWGPVRDRCRPTVTFHDEGDFGYEVGFRCCSDAHS